MKRMLVIAMVALTAIVSAQVNPEVAFRAAMETETVKGDLKAAIEQYKVVVESGNRSLAAQALLRMADCHQKLGTDEARSIYQRVVHDYQDQSEALAIARTRLAGSPAMASTRGDRALWTGRDVDVFGTVSPDGRYLSYTDWFTTNNLMLHDFETGSDRALTDNVTFGQFGYVNWSAISRRGDEVAYEWDDNKSNRTELRIVSLRGAGAPAPRVVMTLDVAESIRPVDWSPDGKSIAVLLERADRSTQIGIVGLQDGSLRILKSIAWRGVSGLVFSTDGRHLAYDLAVDEESRSHQIRVIATDASGDTIVVPAAERNYTIGWAPSGHVLFASDRSGALALWGLLVAEGHPSGEPVLLRSDLISSWSLGLSSAGTLYLWKRAGAEYVRVASVDPEQGAVGSSSTFERFIESRGRPGWSADGGHLVFTSCGPGGGGPCRLSIWSRETGQTRDVPHSLWYLHFPSLSPDGRQIVSGGSDRKGRRGVFLIDAATGRSSLLYEAGLNQGIPEWAPDGRSIYRYGPSQAILQRDVASGAERQVFVPSLHSARGCKVSPDARLAACMVVDSAGRARSLAVTALPDGPFQTILQARTPDEIGFRFHWTADSRALLASAGAQLWLAPLTGAPRRLQLKGELPQLHPDGRSIAYVANAGREGGEIWALENVLPALKAGR